MFGVFCLNSVYLLTAKAGERLICEKLRFPGSTLALACGGALLCYYSYSSETGRKILGGRSILFSSGRLRLCIYVGGFLSFV